MLLKPSQKNAIAGFILYDCKGAGAKMKLAKRRLDMISGNVSSYSRLLNDAKRLEEIKELNQLASSIAMISSDVLEEKKRKANKAAGDASKKKLKQVQEKEAAAQKDQEAQPIVSSLMAKFETGELAGTAENFSVLNTANLKMILRHYLNYKGGVSNWKKEQVIDMVVELFSNRGNLLAAATDLAENESDFASAPDP